MPELFQVQPAIDGGYIPIIPVDHPVYGKCIYFATIHCRCVPKRCAAFDRLGKLGYCRAYADWEWCTDEQHGAFRVNFGGDRTVLVAGTDRGGASEYIDLEYHPLADAFSVYGIYQYNS